MLARTACRTSASGSCRSSVASKASTDGRMRSTIERRFRDWLPVGRRSSSSVARTAPHWECPRTTTSRVPNRAAANSTLPTCDDATMFPATRMTNKSPRPWLKTISAGTRESEQPRIMANGSCPAVNSLRRAGFVSVLRIRPSEAKRRFPSRRRSSASRAEIIDAPKPVRLTSCRSAASSALGILVLPGVPAPLVGCTGVFGGVPVAPGQEDTNASNWRLLHHVVAMKRHTARKGPVVGQLEPRRTSHACEQPDPCAKHDRVHFHDQLVNRVVQRSGQPRTATQPDVQAGFPLEAAHEIYRVARYELDVRARTRRHRTRHDILPQVRIRARHTDRRADLVRIATHQHRVKVRVAGA